MRSAKMPAAARIPAALILAVTAGCASGGRSFGAPDELSETEIRSSTSANALELVERLRPRWLREGPPRSLRLETVILVYYDGVRLGEVETLRDLRPEVIRRMQLLQGSQAGHLPGLGSQHVERVILVFSPAQR